MGWTKAILKNTNSRALSPVTVRPDGALLVLGQTAGGGGGRDLFAERYTGYGRSQGVVTPAF